MSSASILLEIHRKEEEAADCESDIQKLEATLEKQQIASDMFASHAEEFENRISAKRTKMNAVGQYGPVNNFADKFAIQMDTILNTATWNRQRDDLLDISENIDTEIAQNKADLDAEKQRLTMLQNDISNLHSAYEAAVRREQEEAAAAAAEAASNGR